MLTRVLSILVALALTCASAHASPLENARRGLATATLQVASELALASTEAVKEKVVVGSATSIRRENYLRARYFDPGNGRFTQQDSFGGFSMDPQSLHKYLYANSDPVQFLDPSGHFGIIQVFGVNINVGGAIAFLGTRAGMTAVAKFSAEIAFEYATGIPVLTSPRGLLRAARSLRGIVGELADGAIARLRAGHSFEKLVREMWSLSKNNTCFKNGRPSVPPGCFIPDFMVTKAGRIVEVKTSMGAVKKLQFQEFIRIARESGQKMTMVFLKKPSPAEAEQLQRWALEVSGQTDDLLLSIVHVLD